MIASFPDFYFPEIPSAGKRVVVGLSGGVDSSVAAWILKEMGFDVLGVFMKNWEEEGDCPAKQDWIDAASAADCIGVEIDVVNFSQEYRDRVFESFLKEYASGRTPNPDILCNSEIKFRVFLDHAKAMGADLIATGHYAQVRACRGSNRDAFPDGAVLGECAGSGGRYFELLRGADANKDQSYFLYRLNQEQLSQVCFPVGHLSKKNVRYIAEKIGLPNAKKPDSTGICFIGERAFRAFLNQYLPYDPGPIVDEKGEVLGEHVGLAFYTLGQRQGLGIGGTRCGSGFPWFVSHKDREKNTLVVVQGREHPSLRKRYLLAEDAHWIAPIPTSLEAWSAKIRYRQEDAECQLTKVFSGGFHLQFFSPQWAVTPGQSVVLYRGTVCLGGGVIAAAHNELFVD